MSAARSRLGTVRRIGLSIVAGGLLTWGIAWGCALWSRGPGPPVTLEVQPGPWPRGAPSHWRAPETCTRPGTRFGCTAEHWRARDDGSAGGAVDCAVDDYRFGWPMRAMQALYVSHAVKGLYARRALVATGKDPPEWLRPRGGFHILPTRVVPLGFAVNTLLGAGLVFWVLEGHSLWLRRSRRRMGWCERCGYDRVGFVAAAACPECGREGSGGPGRPGAPMAQLLHTDPG